MDKSKYVVLDVETNGLNSHEDDLLSVSLYLPDCEKTYERFLPLELSRRLNPIACAINGITEDDVKNKKAFTQKEFDSLIEEFELDRREILHYGRIDESFLKTYLERHKITGFSKLVFRNIKKHFITTSFSNGEYTKDNLCNGLGIDGVTEVHNGLNDCRLEWKLFEKINGQSVLCVETRPGTVGIYRLLSDYYVPASRICYYPNFKYYCDLPKMKVQYEEVFSLTLSKKCKKGESYWFQPAGIASESIIKAMLRTKEVSDFSFAKKNWKQMELIGSFVYRSFEERVPVMENEDGTLEAVNEEDEKFVEEINESTLQIAKELPPLIRFIKETIFKNKRIVSQEEVIDDAHKLFGYCDFSNEEACLEMKFSGMLLQDCKTKEKVRLNKHKYQYLTVSNGRPTYLMVGGDEEFKVFLLTFLVGDKCIRESITEHKSYGGKRVAQYDKKGKKVADFDSAAQASVQLGIGVKAIRNNCLSADRLTSGYQFKYVGSGKKILNLMSKYSNREKPARTLKTNKTYNTRRVYQYDKSGKLIQEHISIKAAQEKTGVLATKISMVCNGFRKTAGGFVWKYLE